MCIGKRFNQLKEVTDNLTGLTTAKGAAALEVDAVKADLNKATPKQQPVQSSFVKQFGPARTERSAAKNGQHYGYYRQQPQHHLL